MISRCPFQILYFAEWTRWARRQKTKPFPCLILSKFTGECHEYLKLSPENFIEIGAVVSEIWPGKVKSQGCICSSSHVYSAKYSILVPWVVPLAVCSVKCSYRGWNLPLYSSSASKSNPSLMPISNQIKGLYLTLVVMQFMVYSKMGIFWSISYNPCEPRPYGMDEAWIHSALKLASYCLCNHDNCCHCNHGNHENEQFLTRKSHTA